MSEAGHLACRFLAELSRRPLAAFHEGQVDANAAGQQRLVPGAGPRVAHNALMCGDLDFLVQDVLGDKVVEEALGVVLGVGGAASEER